MNYELLCFKVKFIPNLELQKYHYFHYQQGIFIFQKFIEYQFFY